MVTTKNKARPLLLRRLVSTPILLMLLLFLTSQVKHVSPSSFLCINDNENEQSQQQCHPTCENKCINKQPVPSSREKKKLVLSINAANGNVNWERINSLYGNDGNWEVQELVLKNFGMNMRNDSFNAALKDSFDTLQATIETLKPDVLLGASKGVGVIAYLASKNVWVERPIILLSPIPNPIDGLINKSIYGDLEWNDTIDILRNNHVSPVMVIAGSSPDEEILISEALQEQSACGKMPKNTRTFKRCKDWFLIKVPGDHGWKNTYENEPLLAKLINVMFQRLDLK